MTQKYRKNTRRITLAHGEGGSLTRELIEDLFRKGFRNPILDELADSALLKDLPESGSYLCFTTDSTRSIPSSSRGGISGSSRSAGPSTTWP